MKIPKQVSEFFKIYTGLNWALHFTVHYLAILSELAIYFSCVFFFFCFLFCFYILCISHFVFCVLLFLPLPLKASLWLSALIGPLVALFFSSWMPPFSQATAWKSTIKMSNILTVSSVACRLTHSMDGFVPPRPKKKCTWKSLYRATKSLCTSSSNDNKSHHRMCNLAHTMSTKSNAATW